MQLNLDEPDIILIEDVENIDCSAVILKHQVDVKVKILPDTQLILGSIQNLQVFTAVFNPMQREETKIEILKPCEIYLHAKGTTGKPDKMDVTMEKLVLAISPTAVQILTSILKGFTPQQETETEVKDLQQDYSNLWKVKNLSDESFWFLDAVQNEAEVTEALSLASPDSPVQVEETLSTEELRLHLKAITLVVEAGVGRQTVPMVVLESSIEGEIRNWSSQLYLCGHINMEMEYYNDGLAVWEPLVETIEKGQDRERWQLKLILSKNSDMPELTASSDAEAIASQPAVTSLHVESKDILELTVSKVALKVLTNLSEAFSDAVEQAKAQKSEKYIYPYIVRNFLGMPITLMQANGTLQLAVKKGNEKQIENDESMPLVKSLTGSTTSDIPILRGQEVKDDTCICAKIETDEISSVRTFAVSKAKKTLYQLPKKTYPGDQWSFVVDVSSVYGTKIIAFYSQVQVINHFHIPVEVYYQLPSGKEIQCCGKALYKHPFHVPIEALYTTTNQLLFKPSLDEFSVSSEQLLWKDLADPDFYKVLSCKSKNDDGKQFFIHLAGEIEQAYFEETGKKTIASICYKLHLLPTVTLRNVLPIPVHYAIMHVNEEFCLNPGESKELVNARLGQSTIYIEIKQYLDRNWICNKQLEADFPELSVWTFGSHSSDKTFTMDLGVQNTSFYGSMILTLYCPFWMVNRTGKLLTYKIEEGNVVHHPPDLETPVMFSFKAKSFFTKKKAYVQVDGSEWSKSFSIDAAGSSGIVQTEAKDGTAYWLGLEIKLSHTGLTKVVVFTPCCILFNNCRMDLECMETTSGSDWVTVPAKKCIGFWAKSKKNTQLVVRYCNDTEESMPFSITKAHTTLLKLTNSKGGIVVECQVTQSNVLLTFTDYGPSSAVVLLINHSKSQSIQYWQSGKREKFFLHPQQWVPYTWDDPLGEHKFFWTSGDASPREESLEKDGCGDVTVTRGTSLYWASFLDNMRRVLLFTDDAALAAVAQQAGELERSDQEIIMKLQGVGLSLVNHQKKREISYISIASSGVVWEGKKSGAPRYKALTLEQSLIIEKAYIAYQNGIKAKTQVKHRQLLEKKVEVDFGEMMMYKPKVRNIQRRFQPGIHVEYKTSPHHIQLYSMINRVQVDDQIPDAVFPVVFAPVPPAKSVAMDSVPKPFVEMSIIVRTVENSPVKQFKYFKVLVQEFHIKADQGFLGSLLSFFAPETPTEIDYVQLCKQDADMTNVTLQAVADSVSSEEQRHFYDYLHFSPLKVHISFSLADSGSSTGSNPVAFHSNVLNIFIQSVGVTITNINDAVLCLDCFQRQNKFLTQHQLLTEALSHYKTQTIKQVYVVILGLDVIGNPVGLLFGLQEGVESFFYEPFQGAIQGPEEFLNGLAIGVKTLLGHTVGGTAGAASRIMGTFGKGIAALTMDKSYQKRRQLEMNKRSQNVAHGLAQGGKGLVMGVFQGVTGVITKPIEGAREEGVAGFAKGTGIGLIGIVARPASGLADFASSALDSIKRVTDMSEEVRRQRYPRYIQADSILRPYVKLEAEGHNLLQETEKGKFSSDKYIIHYATAGDSNAYLMITNMRVLFISKGDVFGQWNCDWHYSWGDIKEVVHIQPANIKILLKEPKRKKKFGLFQADSGKIVTLQDSHACMIMLRKIEEAKL